ncbi:MULTISPECIES: hypothetical protein [Acetobacter]|uniref:Uncharacterized protein n=2 Tax=Acetobacter TaxID=434 RepID=A0AAN1PFZ8_9PROT|nr:MULTISPECIES: hypothetical protein [Acetobacter]ASL41128.1 hypothetical protein CBI36_12495 [Acetobacter oryzifermentans]AXM99548.1 hypothetical protein CJF59_02425 [Acetobacter pomorum]KAA8391372.1 hypothetical protein FKW22_14850 [Acetobacter sp. DmW_125124]KAA8394160.1 hypothetical protein FKW20_13965 [Acetobacter sp. DmW_125127]KAA8399829.1 hypothetical protein FKW19_02780 [Acetobacter sp. DmW_125128]
MIGAAGRAHHDGGISRFDLKIAIEIAVFVPRTLIEAAFNEVQVESRMMLEIVDFPKVIEIATSAELFDIVRRSAYCFAASGRIVTIKIGTSRFIETESIQYHIQRSITFRQLNVGTPGADLRS